MGANKGGAGQGGLRGPKGLYQREDDHDSFGIGFVADIKGRRSHAILQRGLEVLERMEHRGAESADNKTGDGAGVLLHIPHEFYKKHIPGLPEAGEYGTGLIFFPNGAAGNNEQILAAIDQCAAKGGFSKLALREVPVQSGAVGLIARAAEPAVKQLTLVPKEPLPAAGDGVSQLRDYYSDLCDESVITAVALVHSRFSTNTFPDWPLAQPFRMVAHNGEINTVKGNRFWMAAREALFSHPRFDDALGDILPVI